MCYAQGACRFNGSGLSGLNGALDVANRIIPMFPGGRMTMCEFQPVVASYYDGATYLQKQLILANEPWSGYYMLDSGFYMSLHFSRFIKKGWAFVESACFTDGKPGGDGHSVVDATYSYMTCTDTKTGDYSTVITNTTDSPIDYTFSVSGTDKAGDVIETELDGEALDTGYTVPKTGNRQAFYAVYGLENKHHVLTVKVKERSVTLDSAEVLLADVGY